MPKIKSKEKSSLLDIYPYSKDAFQYLYDKLTDENFKRRYIIKDKPINAVTGIIWDITQGEPEITEIISTMDKMVGIRSEKTKSRLEKIIDTWLKKAYNLKLQNGYVIHRSFLLRFVKTIYENYDENIKRAAIYHFDKYNDKNKKKIKRAYENIRLNDLQERYPEFNILDAYAYALITEKFKIKEDDLIEFDNIISLLKSKND
ncbi:hypothetical protein [Sulfurimonas xiamenensis]|uniref:Uncharacterized protein n=1 Tax=Sulfurimonas xiamenensis TaxID=2590021 RepID=A0AAJ4DMG8_9BACT|nr:hypothetical protein [Sulfurimonas xiamenensis]QFR43147.1 hypothetical protein FJR47_04205 [Sulfurimonas xiamenensis]